MKITNIINSYKPITINYNKPQNNTNFAKENNINYSYAEILGKSQVNFKGVDNFELNQNDKLFINSAAHNLKLSKEKKEILKKEVINFLQDQKLKSISDIDLNDGLYQEAQLIDKVLNKLHLSEIEVGVFTADLYDRIDAKNNYIPTDRRFDWDKIVMKPLINGYGLNDKIFKVMVSEAVEKDYDSLLDIFKRENNPIESKTCKALKIGMSDDSLCNLVLDLNALSNIDDIAKRYEVMYEAYADVQSVAIASEIKYNFDINDKLNNIVKYIKKLDNENISNMQVAFEIADKYNLPINAEQKIVKIIEEWN